MFFPEVTLRPRGLPNFLVCPVTDDVNGLLCQGTDERFGVFVRNVVDCRESISNVKVYSFFWAELFRYDVMDSRDDLL